MRYSNEEIARLFQGRADLLELKGELVFKVRAYQRVARALEGYPLPVEEMVREGKDLRTIPGIGDAIAKKIIELIATGKVRAYEEVKAEFPEGVLTLMEVPGVGPKTAWRITKELGISTVEELEGAIKEGRLADLPRLGEKTAANILRHIQSMRGRERRIPIGKALPVAEEIIAVLKELCPGAANLSYAGSLRRWQETVGDIDIMGTSVNPQGVIDAFVRLPSVVEVLGHGPKKASVVVSTGLQVDLRIVDEESFGALIQYFTGSKQHNILLGDYANKMGFSLNEYGITDMKTGKIERFTNEEDFYSRLGLQYIPPELREGMWEVELAARHALPGLVELRDIRGDLHVHSDWSDGKEPLEVMVAAAKSKGYEYVAITDHSVGRGIANGLTVERLHEQKKQIAKLEDRVGMRVFQGSEVDIRSDGSLDFPDEVLNELDIVVASVHSAMEQEMDKITQRIIKAIRNPHVDIIGHLTTRLLGRRDPIDVDMEAIFEAACKEGVAMEINAAPERLDLKDTHVLRAKELGVPLVIDTDSHTSAFLDVMRFGVAVARRGWCEPKHIYNTRPLREFQSWLARGASARA